MDITQNYVECNVSGNVKGNYGVFNLKKSFPGFHYTRIFMIDAQSFTVRHSKMRTLLTSEERMGDGVVIHLSWENAEPKIH